MKNIKKLITARDGYHFLMETKHQKNNLFEAIEYSYPTQFKFENNDHIFDFEVKL